MQSGSGNRGGNGPRRGPLRADLYAGGLGRTRRQVAQASLAPTPENWQRAGVALLERDPIRFAQILAKVEEMISIYQDPLGAKAAETLAMLRPFDTDDFD